MNDLIKKLDAIRTTNAFEAQALEDAIEALEAADRMAEIVEGILENCNLPPKPSITAAYRQATQGRNIP